MASFFSRFKAKDVAAVQAGQRIIALELSGPFLRNNFETLISACDDDGGAERYVLALKYKIGIFQDGFHDGAKSLSAVNFVKLCMFMPTVRRRVGDYVENGKYNFLRRAMEGLFGEEDVDTRINAFVNKFPQDKKHRWVKDLATEILHNTDPETYPLMHRWVWDRKANSGVIREMWHGDVDSQTLEVDDDYEVFMKLREELSDYLSSNGIYADVLYYVDLLCAGVYAGYVSSQGGLYLKADFTTREEPIVFTRRLLGLDGVAAKTNLIAPSMIEGQSAKNLSIETVLRLQGSN
ncbi:MAG: hypothetical protein V3U57_06275 [Robiginitomaculum sp.]